MPDVNVFNMPFVFRDVAHMRKVIDGPIGDELLQKVTDSPAKLVGLGWMDGGARNLYTKKPVKTPADLAGQKVRMMGNPLFVDTMNAMGGNGIAMAYGEVFTALQTGVIDGAENNPPSYFTANHYNTPAKYYAQTNHLIIPEIFVMSKVSWDKLSKEDQALVKKVSREAQLDQRALWDKSVADYSGKLKAAGIQFIDVDQKPFFDATAPVRAKYGAQVRRADEAHQRRQVNPVLARRRWQPAAGRRGFVFASRPAMPNEQRHGRNLPSLQRPGSTWRASGCRASPSR